MRTLNNTILELHTHLNQVNSLVDAVHNSTSDIISQLEKKINFDQLFISLDNFWTDVNGQADNITRRLRLAFNSFEKRLEDASGPTKITLYCVGGCLTFITLIATIVNMCTIYQVTRSHPPSEPEIPSKGSLHFTLNVLFMFHSLQFCICLVPFAMANTNNL